MERYVSTIRAMCWAWLRRVESPSSGHLVNTLIAQDLQAGQDRTERTAQFMRQRRCHLLFVLVPRPPELGLRADTCRSFVINHPALASLTFVLRCLPL